MVFHNGRSWPRRCATGGGCCPIQLLTLSRKQPLTADDKPKASAFNEELIMPEFRGKNNRGSLMHEVLGFKGRTIKSIRSNLWGSSLERVVTEKCEHKIYLGTFRTVYIH